MSFLATLNSELASVVEGALPSLVQVRNGRGSGGAGTVWHHNGLIVTNAHVVAPSRQRRRRPVVVLPNGEEFEAHVVAVDERYDIAALTIDAHDLATITLGNSDDVAAGDWVTAIGHPWGVRNGVTSGMVIGVAPPVQIPYDGAMIQVGLHMRPGHSGGPMVDDAGRLVGINCMIAGPDVGLAVPVNTAKRFLKQALTA